MVSLNSQFITGIGLPPLAEKDQLETSNVLLVNPNLEFVIFTVSPISNSKASKSKTVVKLICCLAFCNWIFANLWTVVLEVVNGKLNSPNILSPLSSVSKVLLVNIG